MGYITISEYAILINTTVAAITANHSSTYVDGVIGRVSDMVETYCLGTLFESTVMTDERHTAYVRGRRPQAAKLLIQLNHTPVTEVSTVEYRVGNTDTTMSTTNLDYDPISGIINLWWYGPIWRTQEQWTILVSYTAGYTTVPDNVKEAVALLTREWIDADDRVGGGTAGIISEYRIGNYMEKYAPGSVERGNIGLGTVDSLRAQDLLRKYRRPGVR
ncbi:hypothetical protein KKF82_05200 [Patescibacteria group bacterium]|nr:hypothetical protein [Patescibacteria group bacterium]